MSTWMERNIQDAELKIAWARAHMPGAIGSVPLHRTTEIDEIPLEMLGDRPPLDRHMLYESDFNALVAIEVAAGRLDQDTAEGAMINFHDAIIDKLRGGNVPRNIRST